METQQTYIAKTLMNFEDIIEQELLDIGATNIEKLNRAVKFTGDLNILYKANYLCRTALRILVPIATFEVNDQDDLYREVKNIPWENYLSETQTFAFDSTESYSDFTNSLFISMKAKDALADRFRDLKGIRPSVDRDFPHLRINVHIFRSQCTISLDSSGYSLHKRGYRADLSLAPLNEVLSAGLILLSNWDKQSPFIDPMCGSATNLIEACMIAYNYPAQYFRKEFGFENWANYNPAIFKTIREEAELAIKTEGPPIIGIDSATKTANIGKANVKTAGFKDKIQIINTFFERYENTYTQGTLVINPPYGERLDQDNIFELYKTIGDTLKTNYKGFNAYILSSNMEAFKFIGLKPSGKIDLLNGSLECKYCKYELFAGNRKEHLQIKATKQ